jgi:hypothetical protein
MKKQAAPFTAKEVKDSKGVVYVGNTPMLLNSSTSEQLAFTHRCGHAGTVSTFLCGSKIAKKLAEQGTGYDCPECKSIARRKRNRKVAIAMGHKPSDVFAGEEL